jgi:hypothetical protein
MFAFCRGRVVKDYHRRRHQSRLVGAGGLSPSTFSRRIGFHINCSRTREGFIWLTACILTDSLSQPSAPQTSVVSSPPRLLRLLPAGSGNWRAWTLETAPWRDACDEVFSSLAIRSLVAGTLPGLFSRIESRPGTGAQTGAQFVGWIRIL